MKRVFFLLVFFVSYGANAALLTCRIVERDSNGAVIGRVDQTVNIRPDGWWSATPPINLNGYSLVGLGNIIKDTGKAVLSELQIGYGGGLIRFSVAPGELVKYVYFGWDMEASCSVTQ